MKQFFFIFTFFSTLWSMNVMAFEVDGISYDVLSESDKTAFVAHQSKDIAGDVQIPCQVSYEGTVYTVTKIGARAFYECAELTSVRLPDNIIEIGDDAFIRCRKLKDINIPKNLQRLGVMFDLTATTALPLLLSALTASTVAYFLMGTSVQFRFTVDVPFALSQLPFYMVLGVFCAAVSLYFLRTTDRVEGWFSRRRNPWTKMLIGGLSLGLLVMLFPPLYGEGYGMLTELLHGDSTSLFSGTLYSSLSDNAWVTLALLFLLILLKAVATATTIGSGGVGGTFGPSLIIGGLSGYFIAMLCNQLGLPQQDTANFALVGMAAVMTGVMHAPFMATFLIADITGGYGLLVPLLTASAVTYLCVSPFERHSIYARKLAEHGDLLTHDKDASAWRLLDMQSLIETNFVIVRSGGTLRDLVDVIQTSRRNIFPVLSDDDKFLGVIVLDDVRKIIFRPELYDTVIVDDLMHPLSEGDLVRSGDSLSDVVEKFKIGNRYNLVVVDDKNNYLGFLSRANTFSAYRRFISDTSDE